MLHQSASPISYQSLSDDDSPLRADTDVLEEEDDEDNLNEAELRDLYDREEIDKFLTLFSTFVTEVQAPEAPSSSDRDGGPRFANEAHEIGGQSEIRPLLDDEWTPILPSRDNIGTTVQSPQYNSLSEDIACRYLVPLLPYQRTPSPPFTIGRFRVTLERLYLVLLKTHKPFFERLIKLATWEEYQTSLFYCVLFWLLWWYNFLLPALVLRILVSLLKRRLFPYPTIGDLRRQREEVLLASNFGRQVSDRLSASSFGITETWRLFRLFGRTQQSMFKGKARDKFTRSEGASAGAPLDADSQQGATILDDLSEGKEAQDMKRTSLQALDELADLHERIRNIFLWRRPRVSRRYGFILSIIFLITLLPTQYLFKFVFFALGFVFWHVTPLLNSFPSNAWERMPPPFSDAPTDAEYAMELISRRIAAGLHTKPTKPRKTSKKKRTSDATRVRENNASETSADNGNSIDWKKWGDRLALGKSAVQDFKRLKPGNSWPIHEAWPPRHPFIPSAIGIAQPTSAVETRTFPCQQSSVPGLITLTEKTLFFTPLMSQDAKLVVQLAAVKGVKKVGLLKGLLLRWNDSSNERDELREEKFIWVGGRDELFARLVGSSGARWIRV